MSGLDNAYQPVRLCRVPVRDFVALQVYFDDMVREMQLIAVGNSDRGAEERLADLAVDVQHDIAGPRNRLHPQVQAAEERGVTHADLVIELTVDSVADAWRLIEVTEALDAKSRRGMMLTAPASDKVIGLLRWIVSEVDRQVAKGYPPTPYRG